MIPGWPVFTDQQVRALEEKFPNRCIRHNENLEDHLRHAGMVELIAMMRSCVPGNMGSALDLTEEEEDLMDAEAEQIATAQQGGT